MWSRKTHGKVIKNRTKLSKEIFNMLCISFVVAVFSFNFLYFTSGSIRDTYLYKKDYAISQSEEIFLGGGLRNVCFLAALIVFIAFFLFLIGQKIAYILAIIEGVNLLREGEGDHIIKVEGNDELADLARSINYFSKSQKELIKRENELKEKKEEMIRSLSHDIRTPLTSIIAYSEYIKAKEDITYDEMRSYIVLIESKAQQMKVLTNQLLNQKEQSREYIKNGKLLIEQLIQEWEEQIENKFVYHVEWCTNSSFSIYVDIQDMRRIFDNIASNIIKYADPRDVILLQIAVKEDRLILTQTNTIKAQIEGEGIESHKIGLKSIAQISQAYDGNIQVNIQENYFNITICLRLIKI